MRVASLIVVRDRGTGQKAKFSPSSAQELLRALTEAEGDITRAIPPLAPVLHRIRSRVEPLCTGQLDGSTGARTLAALTRLYLDLVRYPEAAIVLREAWSSRYAEPAARVPCRSFDVQLRDNADKAFRDRDPDARDFAKIRNDIEHGGFNADPQPPESLKQRLEEYLARFEMGIE